MKLAQLILEVSIEQLRQQFVDSGKISEKDFKEIETASNGKSAYATWLAKKVSDGSVKSEDIYKFKEYFEIFSRRKRDFTYQDINQYKGGQGTIDFLRDVTTIKREESQDVSSKKGVEKFKKYEQYKIGESGGFTYFKIPKDREDLYNVSCDLGSGTEWCTASGKRDTYYRDYIAKGPLYIIINRQTGEKYQISYEAGQFMDKNDRPLLDNSPKLLKKFFGYLEQKEHRDAPLIYKLLYDRSSITERDLTVEGTLYIDTDKNVDLPDGLTVGGDLYLENLESNDLPDDLFVNGDLDTAGTRIDNVPQRLHVNGDWILSTAIWISFNTDVDKIRAEVNQYGGHVGGEIKYWT